MNVGDLVLVKKDYKKKEVGIVLQTRTDHLNKLFILVQTPDGSHTAFFGCDCEVLGENE